MELTSQIFVGLNDSQKQAVTTIDGPVLIVAGPGTGKTLTIVRRIAYLIQQGVRPGEILAVTFTNRAAREMRERIHALLGRDAGSMFIGTFHLLGLKMIKDSRPEDFVIYGRDEQIELLKSMMNGSVRKGQQMAENISRLKNFMADADDVTKEMYEAYQSALKRNNAFDFDDLIRTPIDMLKDADVTVKYRDKFKYVIVDEYQDINPAQYRLLKRLTGGNGNICAVGDSDQAIYAFRGADMENFLNFEKDFTGSKRITLSENYRSTGTILNAANHVIKNNKRRIDKAFKAVRIKGDHLAIISAPDERTEGEAIIREIEARMGGTSHYRLMQGDCCGDFTDCSYRFSDFAVLYRTNTQVKALEEAFIESGIPYQVVGRRSSRQAKEIEETLAYLKSFIRRDDAEPDPADEKEAKLLTAGDFFDPRADAVALMTMHMAKGLEFKVVFIAGVEDGLIPYTIRKDEADVEEERRLFYVGMTRAKDELFLLCSRSRFLYGQRLSPLPSPFLDEISGELTKSSVIPDKVKNDKRDNQMNLF